MTAPHWFAAFCLLVAAPAGAQQTTFQDALLDKFATAYEKTLALIERVEHIGLPT